MLGSSSEGFIDTGAWTKTLLNSVYERYSTEVLEVFLSESGLFEYSV